MSSTRLITTKGFLQKIGQRNRNRLERPFCFIIGAGASRSAGIATGTDLAKEWLEDLYADLNFDNLPLQEWATEKNLGIKDFDVSDVGSFYPQIYRRRFADSPQDGYACLEDKMQGVEPSFGYSILAYLLSNTPHKIVITTNFDNLVADSLSIHSTTFPIVVSDDSLARYAQVDLRRPLIAKVHGGLGFSMKSNPDELDHLSEAWKRALQQILSRYTPIVIGYEGNDGSLMKCLEEMDPEAMDGIYWCFHCPEGDAREEVKKLRLPILKLVEEKNGHLVPIPGFDELMLLIRNENCLSHSIPNLLEAMEERAREREKSYREQEKQLSENITKSKSQHEIRPKSAGEQTTSESKGLDEMLQKALVNLAHSHKEKPWWMWENEANEATSTEDKDRVYTTAIQAMPNSAPLLGNYANFLSDDRKEFDKAEELYKRAIEADPKHSISLGNYALFLSDERKEFDKAEEFYKLAIEADPNYANNLSNYAIFLYRDRKESDKAEEFYKRAVEADPKHANSLGNYAVFLSDERKEFDKAEEFYKRAVEADPKHANNLDNYAIFLYRDRKESDKAEEFFKRAIEADPKHASSLGNYAIFLYRDRKEYGKAEEFFKRAIEVDPKHASNLGNYAIFLCRDRKEPDKADEFFKRAIEADPKNINNLGNYAIFLYRDRKESDKAEEFFKLAIEADPKHANSLGNYAIFLYRDRKESDKAEEFFKLAIEADPKHAINLGNYAIFLYRDRKEFDKAEEFYKRAIKADPKHANSLGNYAQFIFKRGDNQLGMQLLEKAEQYCANDGLKIELAFYRLAHDQAKAWKNNLLSMKQLIHEGLRTLGWSFASDIAVAKKAKHKHLVLLQAIADVLTKDEPASGLAKYPEWGK